MDQSYLLALAIAVIVALGAVGRLAGQARLAASDGSGGPGGADSPIAASTEGSKLCPRCAMGNLWTERRCSACRSPLKG